MRPSIRFALALVAATVALGTPAPAGAADYETDLAAAMGGDDAERPNAPLTCSTPSLRAPIRAAQNTVINVEIDATRYPQSAAHWADAMKARTAAGLSNVFTYAPDNADANRATWNAQVDTAPGYDRDEFPFAATVEGGLDATKTPSIRYVESADNRGSGAAFKVAMERAGACPMDKFKITLVRPAKLIDLFAWEGDWQTDYGLLNIWQPAPHTAFGIYDYEPGSTVEGDVKGSKSSMFEGTWKETNHGPFEFKLAGVGEFKGKWKRAGAKRFETWDGTRLCGTRQAVFNAPGEITVKPVAGKVQYVEKKPLKHPFKPLKKKLTLEAPAWVRTSDNGEATVGVKQSVVRIPPGTQVRLSDGKFKATDYAVKTEAGASSRAVIRRWFCAPPVYDGPTVVDLHPD